MFLRICFYGYVLCQKWLNKQVDILSATYTTLPININLSCYLDSVVSYPDILSVSAWYWPLQWHHNERHGVSNHQRHDGLLNRLFRRRSKKISKFRVTGLCEGNSPVTGEFHTQRANDAENVSIWWPHHDSGWREGFQTEEHLAKLCLITYSVYWRIMGKQISTKLEKSPKSHINAFADQGCIVQHLKSVRRLLYCPHTVKISTINDIYTTRTSVQKHGTANVLPWSLKCLEH